MVAGEALEFGAFLALQYLYFTRRTTADAGVYVVLGLGLGGHGFPVVSRIII